MIHRGADLLLEAWPFPGVCLVPEPNPSYEVCPFSEAACPPPRILSASCARKAPVLVAVIVHITVGKVLEYTCPPVYEVENGNAVVARPHSFP